METQKLSYRIHPGFLDFASEILRSEKIPFELKYETICDLVGYINLKIEKALELEHCINAMKSIETSSLSLLQKEQDRMKYLLAFEKDYELIKSDMKALIFHVCLEECDDKSQKKKKIIRDILRSNLSWLLLRPSRKHFP